MDLSRSLLRLSRPSKPLRPHPRALSPRLAARQRPFHHSAVSTHIRHPQPKPASPQSPNRAFHCSNSTAAPAPQPPTASPDAASAPPQEQPQVRRDVPAYKITFTCKPCLTRATHRMSKQGYHKGTVLITCPNCKARHLISDHLKIFKDQSTTIEDILKAKGEGLTKGTLGEDGDIEFWEDGTVTQGEGEAEGERKAAQLA
ncbi:MAG: hypothetical protein LQ340_000892 [Diploschistes diacapsis]|nr:MAG: hypothetical protein LQ340_000892 [Diploschistes diacapsis]